MYDTRSIGVRVRVQCLYHTVSIVAPDPSKIPVNRNPVILVPVRGHTMMHVFFGTTLRATILLLTVVASAALIIASSSYLSQVHGNPGL